MRFEWCGFARLKRCSLGFYLGGFEMIGMLFLSESEFSEFQNFQNTTQDKLQILPMLFIFT